MAGRGRGEREGESESSDESSREFISREVGAKKRAPATAISRLVLIRGHFDARRDAATDRLQQIVGGQVKSEQGSRRDTDLSWPLERVCEPIVQHLS